MKKVAIYARVSTDKQEEQRTIESQLDRLREVCRRDEVRIVQEYLDDGISGTTLARPGLDRLRDDASKGCFQGIYILSPDRLARKYVYQALVIEELRKQEIQLTFLDKPVTDKPEDQLLLGIQGLIVEYERAQILERTRRGKLHRARQGEVMGGTAPYGYDYVLKARSRPAHWVVNEGEAEVVRLMFSLCLKQISPHQIARELMQQGIRTKYGSVLWQQTTVQRILENETYSGTAFYNKYRKGKEIYHKKERSEWVPMEVPAIVDAGSFRLAKDLLAGRPQGGHGKRPGRVFPLSGIIRCHYCGCPYNGMTANGTKNSYYRCSNFSIKHPGPRTCWAPAVIAEQLEQEVLKAVAALVLDPKLLRKHLLGLSRSSQDRARNQSISRDKLLKRERNLGGRMERLLEVYVEGRIARIDYYSRRQELDHELKGIKLRLEEANPRKVELDQATVMRRLDQFSERAKQFLDGLNPTEMKEFLRLLFEGGTFDGRRRTVTLNGHIPKLEGKGTSSQFAPDKAGDNWHNILPFRLTLQV